tara:strand:+ start:203 stop:424 length:222 start_codon:yes stop_codon:yes gene_type:complete
MDPVVAFFGGFGIYYFIYHIYLVFYVEHPPEDQLEDPPNIELRRNDPDVGEATFQTGAAAGLRKTLFKPSLTF